MSRRAAVARCYDIPALLRKGEAADMGRIKGDQRGSLVRIAEVRHDQ